MHLFADLFPSSEEEINFKYYTMISHENSLWFLLSSDLLTVFIWLSLQGG